MIDIELSQYPQKLRSLKIPAEVLHEARRRVLDSFGCNIGAQDLKPIKILHQTLGRDSSGPTRLWGTRRRLPAEIAALLNGAAVRAMDYNDTYLSKEPCHPSDLLSSFWAACELSGRPRQGRLVLEAMVLGYEVMCRLCDAASIRKEGWDHVTYLPMASAVGCSYIFGLNPEKTRHAIALAMTGSNALRQTRVGTISDWKAACAANAARSGLMAARLAQNGFTGPSDIFSGRHGFFNQVSGPFKLDSRPLGKTWKMLDTHTKYFPAEHHAQSAIEAAIRLKPAIRGRKIRSIDIWCFDAAVQIIGSEKEKWLPTTRETADHSLPYLTAAALLDGDINAAQYERKKFMDRDVRALMKITRVRSTPRFSRLYPKFLPTRLEIKFSNREGLSCEIMRPLGYAGRPMKDKDIESKFRRLASCLSEKEQDRIIHAVLSLEKLNYLKDFSA